MDGQKGLHYRDHIAKVEWVLYSLDGYFVLPEQDGVNRKVQILGNFGSSSVELLHEFPDSLGDYVVVFPFFDVALELGTVHEDRVINGPNALCSGVF